MITSGLQRDNHGHVHLIATVFSLLEISLLVLFAVGLLILFLRILNRRHNAATSYTFLQLIPPSYSDKTPIATTQLFVILHQVMNSRSWIDWVLQRRRYLSLEVVSTRKQGIRYVLRAPSMEADIIARHLNTYLPAVRMKKLKDYYQASRSTVYKIDEFHQTGQPRIALKTSDPLDQHDPIAYMTSAMTQLKHNEMIALQILLTPISRSHTQRSTQKSLSNRTSSPTKSIIAFHVYVLRLLVHSILFISDAIAVMIFDTDPPRRHHATNRHHVSREWLQPEDRSSQPFYRVELRAYVQSSSTLEVSQRLRAIQSSLASFDMGDQQSLRRKKHILGNINQVLRYQNFAKRQPTLLSNSSCLLTAAEIGGLYHFPFGLVGKTENIQTSLSRSLPAPISLKGTTRYDVRLGTNIHQGVKTPIGLTAAERERHVYVVGGTGNGKSTLLLYSIEQDIRNNKGLAVIDPHGDLAETVLRYIPKNRLNDVIYFNPDDVGYPFGMNLLELAPHLSGDELIREKDIITEAIISVFRKIFSTDDSGGHRIEYVLRNTIQTALAVEDATLFTIFRLLTNTRYRNQVIAELTDTELKDFWTNEMGKAGEYQRIKMSAGITAKVGRFLFSASAKRVLSQTKSTIDFDDIINSGKILICNFSKGLLGEDTASLFGITVLAKLQIATLRRARLQSDQRRPFHLYVDEFQNFATLSFVQLLSEARKYKLFLTMAEQSTSQQAEQRIVDIILANVGTIVCFRSANPVDEQRLLPLFAPFIQTGEMTYLAPFHFFIRLAATRSEEPFSGETVLLKKPRSQCSLDQVIAASRNNYAAPLTELKKVIEARPDVDDYEVDYPLVAS